MTANRFTMSPQEQREHMRREVLRMARRKVAELGLNAYPEYLERVLDADFAAAVNEDIDREICALMGTPWPPKGWKPLDVG